MTRRAPQHWYDLVAQEQLELVAELGIPNFRAKQISYQLFQNCELNPENWTDFPKNLRPILAEKAAPQLIKKLREISCDENTTTKFLWQLHDGILIESVLMRYGIPGIPASGRGKTRATLCISSQAGCGMACPFCATGQGGLERNLSAGEILAQVAAAQSYLRQLSQPDHLHNIVFMGMGEPLANYKVLIKVLRHLVDPKGFGISARALTVSTVGLAPKIRDLMAAKIPVTLAVSLHAPNDELRNELVPMNRRYPLAEVLDAARAYFDSSGRRVSIEYALMRDINDKPEHAHQLAKILQARGKSWVHVNLIPLNPTPGSKWTASRPKDQDRFVAILDKAGIAVTVRDTRGQEIAGACGQLAAKELAVISAASLKDREDN